MNILVTGSYGQLGTHMRLAADNCPQHHCFFTDVDTLDITNASALSNFFNEYCIDVVVNCAAYTNVDKAEDDEAMADKINNSAVALLAQTAKSANATLIHISTDYVFGGNVNNTPCSESQPTNPTGAYGRTKLAGEQAIIQSGCSYIIIRTAWLYSEYGKNFVKTMLDVLKTNPMRKVVIDQVGTPTYAGDLAATIFHIINSGKMTEHQGIYHYSNEGVCSWFDFTMEIARQAGISSCCIMPCRSSEFLSKVVRPSYSVLDKTKIKDTFGVSVPYWTLSLSRCISNLLNS